MISFFDTVSPSMSGLMTKIRLKAELSIPDKAGEQKGSQKSAPAWYKRFFVSTRFRAQNLSPFMKVEADVVSFLHSGARGRR